MNQSFHRILTGALAGLGLAGVISTTALAADGNGDGINAVSPNNAIALEKCAPDRLKTQLDRLSKRLNIGAGQQDAWLAYTNAITALKPERMSRPAPDTSAAAVARAHADMAAARAQKLTQLADATAQLEQVLDPNQRKVLDDVVQHRRQRRDAEFGDRGVDKAPTT